MKWLGNIGLGPRSLSPVRQWIGHGKGKQLCVVGTGRNLYREIEEWGGLGSSDVMALNYAIMLFPRIDFAFTHEIQFLKHWLDLRPANWRHQTPSTHSNNPGAEWKWPWQGVGSSSLGAALTGFAMDYDRVILAGCPIDDNGHFYDPPDDASIDFGDAFPAGMNSLFTKSLPAKDGERLRFWDYHAKNVFDGRVRSLSGRTREILGGP